MHKLFCIMGQTASGKTTLVEKLCKETGMTQVISYTTRPRRPGESDNHIFVDDTVYEEMKENNQIAAYTQIADFKYWSTKEQLYENTFYVVDVIGLQTLEELNLPDISLCSIYINTPSEIRAMRAEARGDTKHDFVIRNLAEAAQFAQIRSCAGFDYAISNLDRDKAYKVLKAIVDIEMEAMTNE